MIPLHRIGIGLREKCQMPVDKDKWERHLIGSTNKSILEGDNRVGSIYKGVHIVSRLSSY